MCKFESTLDILVVFWLFFSKLIYISFTSQRSAKKTVHFAEVLCEEEPSSCDRYGASRAELEQLRAKVGAESDGQNVDLQFYQKPLHEVNRPSGWCYVKLILIEN